MSRKKAKMLFWAALVVLAYIPYLMQSASHSVMYVPDTPQRKPTQ